MGAMPSMLDAAGVTMKRSQAFWSASAAFLQKRRDSISKEVANGQGGSAQIVRKEERWQKRGSHYTRAYSGLSDRFSGVRVPTELYEQVGHLMGLVAPKLQAAYDRHLAKLARDAFNSWPVDSGLSKSLITLEYEVSEGGDTFTGTIRSRAGYTVFIKGQPHRALIDRPGAIVADRIARQALDEIVRES